MIENLRVQRIIVGNEHLNIRNHSELCKNFLCLHFIVPPVQTNGKANIANAGIIIIHKNFLMLLVYFNIAVCIKWNFLSMPKMKFTFFFLLRLLSLHTFGNLIVRAFDNCFGWLKLQLLYVPIEIP